MTSMLGATGRKAGGVTGGDKIPKGYISGQMQQFSPEQMQLFQQMFSQVNPQSYLSKLAGGDQEAFGQLEAPALQQFQGLQGQIASRFSGFGSGARNSSGFKQATNQASSDFAQQLQSQRMGIQRQAMQDLRGISSDLLGQKPYERFAAPKPKPWWQELLLGLNETGAKIGSAAASAAILA